MPATRKSARLSGGPAKQSTLSFNHRVTKNVPKSAKDSIISSTINDKAPPKATSVKPELEEAVDVPETQEIGPVPEIAPTPEKSAAELAAEKLSDATVEIYWRRLESERLAKRVHQEGLTTGEKILRYFDVSSQYGPCVGITRVKRWQRAERLGLDPPIEVLAVLVKEAGKHSVDRAHMDEIMNSTAIGTA